jgi:hypothetical protein
MEINQENILTAEKYFAKSKMRFIGFIALSIALTFLIKYCFLFQNDYNLGKNVNGYRFLKSKILSQLEKLAYSDEESNEIEGFITELKMQKNKYKGAWFDSNYFTNSTIFSNKQGIILINIVTDPISPTIRNISIELKICDGNDKLNSITLSPNYKISQTNRNISELLFHFESKTNEKYALSELQQMYTTKTNLIFQQNDNLEREVEINKLTLEFVGNDLSTVTGEILIKEFSFNIKFSLSREEVDMSKVSKLSHCLSILGLFHLFITMRLLKNFIQENENPKYFSLTMSLQNTVFNAMLSIGGFFYSLDPQSLYDFLIPSTIYFIEFAIFEIRILFLIWREHNRDELIQARSIVEIRKKVTRFYLLLCNILIIFRFCFIFFLLYIELLNYVSLANANNHLSHFCIPNIL